MQKKKVAFLMYKIILFGEKKYSFMKERMIGVVPIEKPTDI